MVTSRVLRCSVERHFDRFTDFAKGFPRAPVPRAAGCSGPGRTGKTDVAKAGCKVST